jgi:hypothetical protein
MAADSVTGKKLSRRQFVGSVAKGAAVLGAVLGATSLVPQAAAATGAKAFAGAGVRAQPVPVPTNWSQTADVVVVGYGGSGAISAITAFDAGANVLILEKTPSFATLGVTKPPYSGGGGSTCMNGGHFDYPVDPTLGATYLYQTSWGATPMETCQAWAAVATQIPAWLTQMGIKYTTSSGGAGFPAVAGASTINSGSVAGGGFAFFEALDGLVQTRGIPIMFNTQATDLIQNPTTGEILGVKVLANDSEVMNIRANRGVILCTGSIEFNEQLKVNYFRSYPAHFYGWAFSTGDGLIMAQNVGAEIWHTDCVAATLVPWFPEYAQSFGISSPAQDGWIYVDKYGNRFMNEPTINRTNTYMNLSDFNLAVPEYTRIPSFIIFDETCRKAAAISSGSSGNLPSYFDARPKWSSDNSVEIGKGWIQQGADIPTLAAAINSTTYVSLPPGTDNSALPSAITVNINPTNLTNTINTYNGYCAAKLDSQFGRPATTLVPIVTPPFYAMALWPGGEAAFAGPIRNGEGQVCDGNFKPIPRLYSAGELGSIRGSVVDTVSHNGELIVFGQISGHNAATENPWTS